MMLCTPADLLCTWFSLIACAVCQGLKYGSATVSLGDAGAYVPVSKAQLVSVVYCLSSDAAVGGGMHWEPA
jgi:histidinol dehydrogenase